MNIRYKLTDQAMQTYKGCQWALGEWKETSGEGKLCGPGWMHCYSSPDLAVLLSPIHTAFESPRLFECECDGNSISANGLKEGWTRMRLVREIDLPVWGTVQRVAFGILCALEVCKETQFVAWAHRWLNGEGRSMAEARAAIRAAAEPIAAADAAWFASAAAAWFAALAAVRSVNEAYDAADAALYAAIKQAIDFPAIIEKARAVK